MPLALIHRSPPTGARSSPLPAWRTCLREVLFVDEGREVTAHDRASVLVDADAYALLVEIVSGLRSPLIGETEVQGQFKAFLASLDSPADHWVRVLGQRVLADARQIRRRHLQGFGVHSYSRLVAPYLTGSRAVVIGTGALACEILGAISPGTPTDLWGRSLEKQPVDLAPGLQYFLLSDETTGIIAREPVTLIIAAPVSGAGLARVLSRYASVQNVIDLRAADQRTSIPAALPLVSLPDLFDAARLATGRTDAHARLRAARADIEKFAGAYVRREELRPFGWDDLCA